MFREIAIIDIDSLTVIEYACDTIAGDNIYFSVAKCAYPDLEFVLWQV